MNLPINTNLCLSIKSKNCKNIQCHHKRKLNENYCGIHLKNNVEIYIPEIPNIHDILEIPNIPNIHDIHDILEIPNIHDNIIVENQNMIIENDKNISNDKNIIYSKNDFFDLFIKNKYEHISIFTLRNNIKNLNLIQIINTKQSKPILIKEIIKLIELERYYKNNYNKLIIIQSIIRKWIINRRKKSCNLDDIMSFDSIYYIQSKFYYLFYDTVTKKSFGYDIRSLICILKYDYP